VRHDLDDFRAEVLPFSGALIMILTPSGRRDRRRSPGVLRSPSVVDDDSGSSLHTSVDSLDEECDSFATIRDLDLDTVAILPIDDRIGLSTLGV